MTTRERILTLADGGTEPHMIAAILGLTVTDVAETLALPGHTPADPSGGGGGGGIVIGPYSSPVLLWEVATAEEQEVRWQPDADHPTIVELTFQYQTPGGILDFLIAVGPEGHEKEVDEWSEPDVKAGIHQRTATVLVGAGEWIQVIGTNGGGGEGASFEANARTAVIEAGSGLRTTTLGPYTVGPVTGWTPTVDLGAGFVGAVREYAIVVTAADLDGGRALNIDFAPEQETELDRPGYAGVQPAGFTPEALEELPATATGNIWLPRAFRLHHEIEEAGEAASVTFHVDLTYY